MITGAADCKGLDNSAASAGCEGLDNSVASVGREADQGTVYPAGLKWTKQRKHVYEVLLKSNEPLSAVQIYSLVDRSDVDSAYALSTIYRILTAFEEKNLVNKTNWMGDGTVVYELNRGGHTHYAVCLACHKRIPLQSCPFAHMHWSEEGEDFTVTGHKLEVYGYCRECRMLRESDGEMDANGT